jgi:hypothetical protein
MRIGGKAMAVLSQALDLIVRVPASVWAGTVVGNVVLAATTLSMTRRRLRRAGYLAAHPEAADRRARGTALTVASLIPAGLFWCMVLAGSFHGLVAFGRDTLGWRDGWEYLVPGTLDGVSVTFALRAFQAVRRQQNPDRCYRVVWGAAAASATIKLPPRQAAATSWPAAMSRC